jgi:diguanylate cyclase (GGDEF)-like protein/PAS domain S-box-containing protein
VADASRIIRQDASERPEEEPRMQAEERSALHESVVRHVRDVITVVGADGLVRFVNHSHLEVDEPSDAAGSDMLDWVHPDDRAMVQERQSWLLGEPGRTSTTVVRVPSGDGGWRHVETHGTNLVDDPDVQGVLYVTRDVEDRARAEVTLVHALGAQSLVADLGVRALRSEDVDSVLRDALERAAGLLGTPWVTLLLLDPDERLRVRLQVGPDPLPTGHAWPAGVRTQAGATLARRHPTISEHLALEERYEATPEQAARGIVSGLEVVLEGVDGPIGVLGAHGTSPRLFSPVDVQFLQGVANVLASALERADRERRAVVQALHDPLTGLPTRSLFADRLEHAVSRIRRQGGQVAVLVVDLDRFKAVNDSWGHAAGDEVLRALGPRLAACARASDTVARYGGDEFVVLCEEDVRHVDVARVAAAIRRACAEPVSLSTGETVMVSASVGISWSVEQGPDAAALLAAADASMYLDKRYGLPV